MESIDIIYFSERDNYLRRISDILNKNIESEFVIICSASKKIDDISSFKHIADCISKAQKKSAEILLGGVKNFQKILEIDENLFCVEKFQGFNFIIFFNSIFDQIINNQHYTHVCIEEFLCEIAENIFVMHPFITLEESFTEVGHYDQSNNIIEDLKHIRKFYRS
ncbi:hypothetical protein [Chryseobacterium indoltheticum]|uniref:hypothetical protein n=1 Tax=Chryseobacterium indoltheticum TaxID=254 RepID=UPI00404121F5